MRKVINIDSFYFAKMCKICYNILISIKSCGRFLNAI